MVNFDDIIAYQTPRVTKIKDWRLGLMWYGGCFIIILYIVVWSLLISKEYMNLQAPAGAIRPTCYSPRDVNMSFINPTPEELDYCYVEGRETVNGTTKSGGDVFTSYTQPCVYYDQDLAVFPSGEESAISLTTRVTTGTDDLPGCSAYESDCPWLVMGDETTDYVANVEEFTVGIFHSFSAPAVKIDMADSEDMNGELVDIDGKTLMEFPKGEMDIINITVFLKAAGIDSLDDESQVTPGRSIRYDGIVLLVYIKYSNTFSFDPERRRYTMTVTAQDTKFKVDQPIYTKSVDSILLWNRHGIKFIFIQTGLLGHFSFSVLLLTFISGVGMVAACSIIVDLLAVYLLPQHELYYKYKYLETPDHKELDLTINEDRGDSFKDDLSDLEK